MGSAELKIGMSLPLTGFAANFGEDGRRGAELAVDQANAEGGVCGKPVRLIVEDDGGVRDAGIAVTHKLISSDKVSAIVGGVISAVALNAAPIARANETVYIATMSSHPDLTTPGGFIYRMDAADSAYATIEANYACQVLKAETAAGLFSSAAYGKMNGAHVREKFEKQGGRWLLSDYFPPAETDFRQRIAQLSEQRPDVAFVMGPHKEIAGMLRQMAAANFKVPLIGTGMLADPAIFDLADGAEEGVYFASTLASDPTPMQGTPADFKARFKERYACDPKNTAVNCYDAVRMVVDAVRAVGPSGRDIDQWLAGLQNYPSVTTDISFTPNGDRILPLTIKRLENRKVVGTGFVYWPE